MKVLTADEMRDVDRRAIELGIPGIVLMENAGHRVVEFLEQRFAPLSEHRIVVFCGKGNNGGDGFVIARQLLTRIKPRSLDVVVASNPEELPKSACQPDANEAVPERVARASWPVNDAATNHKMFLACGGTVRHDISPKMRAATIVIDALLGTGSRGPVEGRYAELCEEINNGFPQGLVVAVDIPSGPVRAHYTVSFVAPKLDQVMSPAYEANGELVVANIGTPPHLLEDIQLNLSEPKDFAPLFAPRKRNSNKGLYGHVLVIGGSQGKTGAVQMTGMAALCAGAGLVTVASDAQQLPPELMMTPLAEVDSALKGKTVVALGPGLGTSDAARDLTRRLFQQVEMPMVVDADALNCLAGSHFKAGAHLRVLTPHPGEMARLTGLTTAQVQADRLNVARKFAAERNVILVLKGDRTITALPDGQAFINPTGSPALATGGTGDILTGLIAGLLAQHPDPRAVCAAVWLHGRAGELGAAVKGEQCFLATDLLTYLPGAIRECV